MRLLLALLLLAGPRAQSDRIRLDFRLDDRTGQRVQRPVVELEGRRLPLLDDGRSGDDAPGDGVWGGGLELPRLQRLSFSVLDEATGEELGQFDVRLPARERVTLALHSTRGEPVLALDSGAAPEPAAGGGAGSGGSAGWLGLLLALVSLAYARWALRRAWREDFLPTWRKLDRWLDAQLGENPPPRTPPPGQEGPPAPED